MPPAAKGHPLGGPRAAPYSRSAITGFSLRISHGLSLSLLPLGGDWGHLVRRDTWMGRDRSSPFRFVAAGASLPETKSLAVGPVLDG